MGMNPTPPGRSKAKDIIKGRVVHGLIATRRLLKGKPLPNSPARTLKGGTPWRE